MKNTGFKPPIRTICYLLQDEENLWRSEINSSQQDSNLEKKTSNETMLVSSFCQFTHLIILNKNMRTSGQNDPTKTNIFSEGFGVNLWNGD